VAWWAKDEVRRWVGAAFARPIDGRMREEEE
jgi:hypothetical protein